MCINKDRSGVVVVVLHDSGENLWSSRLMTGYQRDWDGNKTTDKWVAWCRTTCEQGCQISLGDAHVIGGKGEEYIHTDVRETPV